MIETRNRKIAGMLNSLLSIDEISLEAIIKFRQTGCRNDRVCEMWGILNLWYSGIIEKR